MLGDNVQVWIGLVSFMLGIATIGTETLEMCLLLSKGLHTPAGVNVALPPFSQAAHLKTGKISKATRMAEGVDSFQTKND